MLWCQALFSLLLPLPPLLLGVLTRQVYISTIEAKKYPVLGLQWHPEKNSFEWTRHKQIPHGYWSSEVTHQVGAGGGRVCVCVCGPCGQSPGHYLSCCKHTPACSPKAAYLCTKSHDPSNQALHTPATPLPLHSLCSRRRHYRGRARCGRCALIPPPPQTVRFFINETRRSLASFRDEVDEDIWLIYNDEVVFSGRHLHSDVSVCCPPPGVCCVSGTAFTVWDNRAGSPGE